MEIAQSVPVPQQRRSPWRMAYLIGAVAIIAFTLFIGVSGLLFLLLNWSMKQWMAAK